MLTTAQVVLVAVAALAIGASLGLELLATPFVPAARRVFPFHARDRPPHPTDDKL